MKLLILLAFFSFVHEKQYPVEKYTCDDSIIRIYIHDKWQDISLFNVFIKDDICPYVKGKMKIEFDTYANIEENNVYVFLENELLQKTLIEENVASIKINNPRYKYDLKRSDEAVSVPIVNEEKERKPSTSIYYAYLLILIWLGIVFFYLYIRKRKV